ncbi:aminoacyl-histidine dipeptidase [Campylobacter mucosalis]|uniref:M28 family peptidase n=1 Tax=Campylobacter mucosalis TaxID=202 RepID=UPI0004D6FA1B|nr:M28 family peptidase [Campylobacter mucosalis]KEA46622.1 aminoacyl-histidine dipeptidase [Campylobacter mucosalis]QKF62864.1 peptidase D [Campylobacter mucosalis]
MQKNEVLSKFERLCGIPHCSYDTDAMRDFLADFARSNGCRVVVDELGNIHAIKGEPKICLQSHYDMVCMGDAPNVVVEYGSDGFMRAKNSSLGADNGIGVAMMMQMIAEFKNIECLFTNNEEVGLIGANGFLGRLVSKKLLNLDSEDDNEVVTGCAGGVNVFTSIDVSQSEEALGDVYEVVVSGYPGGHSGNEIHKDIPNAIKILAQFVRKSGAKLSFIEGGERSNSIPTSAKAIIVNKSEPKSDNPHIKISALNQSARVLKNGDKILSLINAFSQGVRGYNTELNLPNDSVNLSLLKFDGKTAELEFFARSMTWDGLHRLDFEISELALGLGFSVCSKDRSVPWKPEPDEFANSVLDELKKLRPNAKLAAIHAGLECGVIRDKYDDMEACSIGPNIYSPHSTREKCEVASVDIITQVVRNIVAKYQ